MKVNMKFETNVYIHKSLPIDLSVKISRAIKNKQYTVHCDVNTGCITAKVRVGKEIIDVQRMPGKEMCIQNIKKKYIYKYIQNYKASSEQKERIENELDSFMGHMKDAWRKNH